MVLVVLSGIGGILVVYWWYIGIILSDIGSILSGIDGIEGYWWYIEWNWW